MKHININILKGQNCVYLVKTCKYDVERKYPDGQNCVYLVKTITL